MLYLVGDEKWEYDRRVENLCMPPGVGSSILKTQFEESQILDPIFLPMSEKKNNTWFMCLHYSLLTNWCEKRKKRTWTSPAFCLRSKISDMCLVTISTSCFLLALSFDRLACVLVFMYCLLIFPIMLSEN